MAELGVLASLVGVVGAGLQLSVALYDFASTLGSAGREIEDMGYDVTLLCAVLKRVQSTLDNPKSTRLSVTAIQTTRDIVGRCRKILDDIKSILSKLRKDGQSDLDIFARVKWTLKRPKVLMLRGSLQSCTTTLHLMLSAIDWARNAIRRSIHDEPDLDHDQDRQMTHSLFLAQQSANYRLEELEDQAINESSPEADSNASTDSLLPLPVSSSSANAASRHRRNRSSAMIDAVIYEGSPTSASLETKRTSVLLNQCLFEGDHSFEQVTRKPLWPLDRRQSLLHSDDLLRRWTKQIDVVPRRERDLDLQPAQEQLLFEPTLKSYPSSSNGPDSKVNVKIQTRPEPSEAKMAPAQTSVVSDTIQVPSVVTDGPLSNLVSQTLPLPAISDDEIFKSFRVSVDDPYYKVLSYAVEEYSGILRSKGYPLDWRQYALYIVFGDQERAVGLDEKPLVLSKTLDREGKKPMFKIRRLISSKPNNSNLESPSKAAVGVELKNEPGLSGVVAQPLLQLSDTPEQARERNELQSSGWVNKTPTKRAPEGLLQLLSSSLNAEANKVVVPPGFGFGIAPSGKSNFETHPEAVAHSDAPKDLPLTPPRTESPTTPRVSIDDPCSKVLPGALLKYGIKTKTDRREYDLCVIHGDVERVIGPDEKPFAIFRDLDRAGKKPKFMLRKIRQPEEKEAKPDADDLWDQAGRSKGLSFSRSPFVGHNPTLRPIDENKSGSGSPQSLSPGPGLGKKRTSDRNPIWGKFNTVFTIKYKTGTE